jgi:hypothetical protein
MAKQGKIRRPRKARKPARPHRKATVPAKELSEADCAEIRARLSLQVVRFADALATKNAADLGRMGETTFMCPLGAGTFDLLKWAYELARGSS